MNTARGTGVMAMLFLAIWAVVGLPVFASSRSIRALGASNVSFVGSATIM